MSAPVDTTLLHPPPHCHSKFYPQELLKYPEYQEYYFMKEKKNDRKTLSHMYKGRFVLSLLEDFGYVLVSEAIVYWSNNVYFIRIVKQHSLFSYR